MKLRLLDIDERDYGDSCVYLKEFIRMIVDSDYIAKRLPLAYYMLITKRLI